MLRCMMISCDGSASRSLSGLPRSSTGVERVATHHVDIRTSVVMRMMQVRRSRTCIDAIAQIDVHWSRVASRVVVTR